MLERTLPIETAAPKVQILPKLAKALNGSAPAAPAWPALKISGLNIAKVRRTKAQRIALAEHLVTGKAELSKPTLKQAAALARVSPVDIYRARRARKPAPKLPSLAEHLAQSSPAERAEAARAFGVARIWDEMISPLVSSTAR
jgi:hypothetical protein